jgi:UPF0716 protein FxsA
LLGRLILLFVFVPLADLVLLLYLSDVIGWQTSIGIVILSGIVGAWAAKLSFYSVQKRARAQLGAASGVTGASGISGASDLLTDGAMIFFAAGLLLTPGFITDVVGFSLLIPPVRRWYKARVSRWFKKNFKIKTMSMESMRHGGESGEHHGRGFDDRETVDGEVLRTEAPTGQEAETRKIVE